MIYTIVVCHFIWNKSRGIKATDEHWNSFVVLRYTYIFVGSYKIVSKVYKHTWQYFSEEAVGNAIKKCGVPREELFITTKVWISNGGYEKAKTSLRESLCKLQSEYIDLVLIHQPFNDYYGTYRAIVVCSLYYKKFLLTSYKLQHPWLYVKIKCCTYSIPRQRPVLI